LEKRILEELAGAISSSVEREVREKGAGVMFSGGLDSTLLAFLSKRFNPRTRLYSVGMKGSQDLEWAGRIAGEFGWDVGRIELDERMLWETYLRVEGMLPGSGLLSLEIGIPVLLCSENASADGLEVLLSGHGADELFGGYWKYQNAHENGEDFGEMMGEDLEKVVSGDQWDGKRVAGKSGVGLAFPFLEQEVVRIAKGVPAGEHFGKGERKPLLREIAARLGVPENARSRPKKALQYGSGIHKVLARLLKAERHG
jgi:asparagine synthase (glutamine-hydrolysing)